MPPNQGGGGKGQRKGSKGSTAEGKKSGSGKGGWDSKDSASREETNGEGQASFDAAETAKWISGRYQEVMEEYGKQPSGTKTIQKFSDLNSGNAWGGGAKPVLPGKEDFLQQLQTALLHFQRARQVEDGKGS
mmetsp:Transcript_9201/g.16910  ORF Transcript_9201/g.16910 Transcript_9201/m.16910 type:complete len:132 (+) Transcript_9201:100-495(+)